MGEVTDHSELMSSFREPDGQSNIAEVSDNATGSDEGNTDEQQYLNMIERIISTGIV